MTKKLIGLILIIPIIAIITLFSTAKTVSHMVDIAVSKLEILNEKIVYLNLDEKETHKILYSVYPSEAANSEVEFSVDPIDDNKLADLSISKDGTITPKSYGSARVTLTSLDGGYQDSVIVHVSSSVLTGIRLKADKDLSDVYIGDTVYFTPEFEPDEASDRLVKFESSNPNIISIDENTGKANLITSGSAKITVTSTSNKSIYDSITVDVKSKGVLNLSKEILTSTLTQESSSTTLTIVTDHSYIDDDISFVYDSSLFNVSKVKTSNNIYDLTITYLTNDELNEEIIVKLNLGGYYESKTITIKRSDKIDDFKALSNELKINSKKGTGAIYLDYSPDDINLDYKFTYDTNLINVEKTNSKLIKITAKDYGYTKLTIAPTSNDIDPITIDIVICALNISITESANIYGLANEFALGSKEYKENVIRDNTYKFTYSTNSNVSDEVKNEYYKWSSSDTNVATITDGIVNIKANGYTTISVGFYANNKYYSESKFKIKCVKNAINCYSYADLMTAVNSNAEAVLMANIDDDFGVGYTYNNGLVYKEIPSTYDITFYENIYRDEHGIAMDTELTNSQKAEAQQKAMIKILVDFTNNLYGNGYTINSNNVTTYGIDSTGNLTDQSIFKGPLNFVGLTNNGSSIVSVKGQDNISFAVRNNVKLDNVILKSCDDSNDLSDFNYVGTTVEILGDNVSITNSRLRNGRTVLRTFGTTNELEKVHTTISNSELTFAREFIIRAGSNRRVVGSYDGAVNKDKLSPYLDGYLGSNWSAEKVDNLDITNEYDTDYIMNFLTVKDTTFKNCGIFAIGLDAHFAGDMLDGSYGSSSYSDLVKYWYNLASTSYGTKLTLEGNVIFDNWIDVNKLDSSTLIDIALDTSGFEMSALNISSIIVNVYEDAINNPQESTAKFKNIIDKRDGDYYVHAGITLFGGGKNYSYVECSNQTSEHLSRYNVSLNDSLESQFLSKAAGAENFRFYIYDAASNTK